MLELFRGRLHDALLEHERDRHAALMTLMMAHGTVRRHVPLPFDKATLGLL